MNVSELARKLKIHPQKLLEVLPTYGFDIGKKAVKVDDKVANQIMKQWRRIQRDLRESEMKEAEEKKLKEKELRKQSGQTVVLPYIITVKEFANRLNLSVTQVISELMKNGILANQNQNIDYETAAIMAEEMGFVVQKEEGGKEEVTKDTDMSEALQKALANSTHLERRAPVVVVMGHVDHGKTKLLDTIRHANIIDTESGGITQHIGAYQTIWKDPKTGEERALTFIDTPGHEAFTVMRSRGAKIADLAILVVAADDGVKPQTEEVIQIIRAAKIPFVVAINKIDKETADVQRTKTDLAGRNIIPEEWGGDVPMVEVSAKANLHIDKLLDTLLLVGDMHEESIKADRSIPVVGTVIESHKDKNIGPIATILVQGGTLRQNDPLVIRNEIYGKVRAMRDYTGKEITEAGPSVPVQIIGFKVAPEVGDILDLSNAAEAQKIDVRQKRMIQTSAEQRPQMLAATNEEEHTGGKTLNLVVKADVLGSLEAIVGAMERFRHEEVGVRIVAKGLGNITEDDVNRAVASHATVIGFRVKPSSTSVEVRMREEKLEYLYYEVIYDILNWVRDQLENMLDEEKITHELGIFKVKAIFRTDRGAMTVGGLVEDGKVQEGAFARLRREGEIIETGKIVTCQKGQDKVKEIPSGTECGVRYEGKEKVLVDDVLEVYSVESKIRKIVFEK